MRLDFDTIGLREGLQLRFLGFEEEVEGFYLGEQFLFGLLPRRAQLDLPDLPDLELLVILDSFAVGRAAQGESIGRIDLKFLQTELNPQIHNSKLLLPHVSDIIAAPQLFLKFIDVSLLDCFDEFGGTATGDRFGWVDKHIRHKK